MTVPSDPLDMARNAAAFVGLAADMQGSDDPDVRLRAHIQHLGKQGMDSALVGGMMALVSIAADLRRLADAHTPRVTFRPDEQSRVPAPVGGLASVPLDDLRLVVGAVATANWSPAAEQAAARISEAVTEAGGP